MPAKVRTEISPLKPIRVQFCSAHLTVKDGKVTTEDLWKEDFSGISGEKNKIEDLSENKALVDESKSVSQKEQKINFEVMKGSAE